MGAGCFVSLDQLRCLQGGVSSVLGDSAESLGRNVNHNMLIEFRNEDTALLEVRLTRNLTTRIELSRTCAVTVASADLGLLTRDFALLCHTYKMS